MPTPTHSFLPQCPGPGPGRTGSTPHSSARPGMQRRTGSAEAADPARRGPGALGRSRRPGAGAGGRRGYPGSSCSTVREPHDAGLVRIQRLPLPGVRPRSPVWRSEMRLSSRLERGLVERMVQNASESARIRPDPAQVAKLRRILDHPRAMPPERGETQTDFGPPHPQDASPSCGNGAPTPVVRWRSRRTVRWRFPRPRPIASGQATTYMSRQPPGSSRASPGHNHPLGQATAYWGRQIAYPNAQFPTPMSGAGARQDPPHSSARPGTQRRTGSAEAA